jgi:hypothetical protein
VPVVVDIPEGSSGAGVAALLQERHVIRSAFGFKILARVKHSQPFVAGRYELTTNMTAGEALAALEAPPKVTTVRVTIPEGLDIEQEAQQADADHVRGAMTMEGYLTHRYSDHRPLSVIIRIRFEQEHGGTGGDSASAAQLFTLLSALAQQPIKCSLAVTGATPAELEDLLRAQPDLEVVGVAGTLDAARAAGLTDATAVDVLLLDIRLGTDSGLRWLTPADRVITDGQDKLQEGSHVEVRPEAGRGGGSS